MADRRMELFEALANADAAGDTAAAAELAKMIHVMDLPTIDVGKGMMQDVPDALRLAGDTVSRGTTDTLRSKIYGTPVEQERATTQAARDRMGFTGGLVDATTAIAEPNVMSKIQRGGRFVRTLGHGLEGGTQAVLNEWGHGERDPMDLAKSFGVGSGLSTAATAAADPIASWWSRRKTRQAAPTTEDVLSGSRSKYGEVAAAGGTYKNKDLRGLAAEITNMKLSPGLDDRAIALRKRLLKDWQGKDISPEEFDKIQRWVRKKMKTADPAHRALGEEFVGKMRDFETKTPVKGPAGQDIPMVNEKLREARAGYARAMKAKEVEEAAAQPRKARGGWLNPFKENTEGPMRDRFGKIQTNIEKKGGAGYTKPEQEGVKKLAEGTTGRNIGEIASRYSPLSREGPGAMLAAFTALPTLGLAPALQLVGTETVAALGRNASKTQAEDLAHLIRDPSGQGIKTDPDTVRRAKDKMAQIMTGGTRAGYNQFGGPR